MNYKILQENIFGKTLKQVVMENREITNNDINFLLNPTNEYVEMPMSIKNINKAIELFISELDNNSKIGVLCDPDVDGLCSTTIMVKFLKEVCGYNKEDIEIFFHKGKTHGLNTPVFKQIKKSDINFLIIPDAGTNDEEQIKSLLKDGKRVLVLDHHLPNDKDMKTIYLDQNESLIGVIVNNQFNDYANAGCGAYVVIKFLEGMTETELVQYYDLVAIANIADSMNILDRELAYYIDRGLNNINNSFFQYALEDLKLEKITPMDISFNVANIMNAVCRYGTAEENEMMIKALLDVEETVLYKPRKSKNNPNPQEVEQSLAEAMVRVAKSIKQKQDKAKKKAVESIKNFVEEKGLNDNKVMVVIDSDNEMVDKRITGLIAMSLVDVYKKSVVLISKSKDGYTGSMRGFGLKSFKEILESTEIIKVTGHNNSAGVFVESKDIPRLIKRVNKAFEDVEVVPPCTLVDCVIDTKTVREKDMREILEMKSVWHQHCKEPMFLIKDVIVETKDIRIPYTTLMVFELDGIEVQKPFCSGVFKEQFLHTNEVKFGKPTLECNLIVKIGYDSYKRKPCLIIVEAETKVVKKTNKKDNIPF